MKSIILVALALVAVAASAPVDTPQIIRSSFVPNPDGSFSFSFETEDGIKREETGVLKEVVGEDGKPVVVLVTRGFYSYTNPEGGVEQIQYVSDENGYHPEGPSIPKAPVARR